MKLVRQWTPFTPGQRSLVLAMLATTAVLLHFACCRWQFSGRFHGRLLGFMRSAGGTDFFGITPRGQGDVLFALSFGLVLPFALLTLAALLGSRWLRGKPTSLPLGAAQRRIAIAALVGVALLLHFAICEWTFMSGSGFGYFLFGFTSSTQPLEYTGVFDKHGVPRLMATLIGLVLPLAAIALAVFMWLGWRRIDRLATGRCTACGYPLATPPQHACTECGAATQHSSAA